MRTTIASATFLLLGAGAATIGARSNIHLLGSDTLRDLTVGTLAGFPPIGALPSVAACPNTSGLVYDGTGSGNGANAMRRGDQEASAMSSVLTDVQACTSLTGAGLPTLGKEAEGLVFALDGLSLTTKPGIAPDASCGGIAFSGAGGAKVTVPGGCAAYGCNAAGEYIPVDERDFLRVLYFGIHGHSSSTTTRDCNSPVRRALVAQYKNLFQNQATCTAGACAGKPLKHAYRRDDGSGTTDVFVSLIGVPGIYQGNNKVAYPTTGIGTQQSNAFCNAGNVGPDHTVQGIHLGFDDSEVPLVGPNWQVLVGDSDFADLDPIRTVCEDGDEVCQSDRTNGLVQVIFPPALASQLNYPTDLCDGGSVDLEIDAGPYVGYFGRCGDGSSALVGGCVIGYKSCSSSTPCTVPGQPPKVTGRSYLCTQQAFPGIQGLCWLNAPQNGEECRGANNWMRNVDGTLVTESSLGAARTRQVQGAFFRKHMNSAGNGGTGTCRSPSATFQIGCLVGSTEPCSIGFAGREATDGAGAPADGASIKGIAPTKVNIQKLVSADNATFVTRYPLSRKLYYNTIIGFGSTFNLTNPLDTTGPGASGEERNLGLCLADQLYRPYWEASVGFIELPETTAGSGVYSFCEDFAEFRRCAGGVRPGIKCAVDADCPGFGTIGAGTCSVAVSQCGSGMAGNTSDNDACANNSVGNIARQCVGGGNPGAACTTNAQCTGGGVCSSSYCQGTTTYCNPNTNAPCAAGVRCRNQNIPVAP